MNTHAKVIALDLGASGGKCFAGLFDDNGFSLKEVHRFDHEPCSMHVADRDGRVEARTFWDDLHIYANMVEGLRAYRREIGPVADSVGIDTWGADGQLVTEDGVALGRMYSYRDHRLDGMVDEVKALIDPSRIYGITGIHFQPFNLSNQLLWYVRHRPGLLRKGVRFLPVPTVFGFYLAGATAVDSTWASVTQLMDAKKKKWSREILRKLSIPGWLMPEIVAPGTIIGALREGLAGLRGPERRAAGGRGIARHGQRVRGGPRVEPRARAHHQLGHLVAGRQAREEAHHDAGGDAREHQQRGRASATCAC